MVLSTRVTRRTSRGGERGVAVVFFAVTLTALLAMGALVLGGSTGYTAVRNAQTAADSAALAGTSAVRAHKQDWVQTPAEDVIEAVESAAADNGTELSPGGCELVAAEYARSHDDSDVIGPCKDLENLSEPDFRDVAGVRVRVVDTRDVPLSGFVDEDSIAGEAVAAATAQPATEGRAPFMVCTSPDAVGHPAQALVPDALDPTGYAVNDAAVGKHFVLHGNQVKYQGRDCGKPSSDWRGLVQFESTFPLPSPHPTDSTDWWQTESGNKNGNLAGMLAGGGACELEDGKVDDLELGCRIAIPLCPKSNGSTSDFRLYCVKLGAFEISHKGTTTLSEDDPVEDTPCGSVKNNIICGRFLGAATVSGGRGRADSPDPNEAAVIKLVE